MCGGRPMVGPHCYHGGMTQLRFGAGTGLPLPASAALALDQAIREELAEESRHQLAKRAEQQREAVLDFQIRHYLASTWRVSAEAPGGGNHGHDQ